MVTITTKHTVLGGKVNLSVCLIKHHAIKTYGEVEVYLHAFLILILDGGE
jgi:hypothetical protein